MCGRTVPAARGPCRAGCQDISDRARPCRSSTPGSRKESGPCIFPQKARRPYACTSDTDCNMYQGDRHCQDNRKADG